MRKYITKSFYCQKDTYEILKGLSRKYLISDSAIIRIAISLINSKQYLLEDATADRKKDPFLS